MVIKSHWPMTCPHDPLPTPADTVSATLFLSKTSLEALSFQLCPLPQALCCSICHPGNMWADVFGKPLVCGQPVGAGGGKCTAWEFTTPWPPSQAIWALWWRELFIVAVTVGAWGINSGGQGLWVHSSSELNSSLAACRIRRLRQEYELQALM